LNGGHILKLKAISGKNQRGFSFVAPQGEPYANPVLLVMGPKKVLTRIRESPKVPQDLIVVDKRLYTSLRAEAGKEVEIVEVDFEIPICTQMTLVVSAKREVDVRAVVRALSDRIQDMESHLDGLLLMEGQVLDLDSLGISVTINELTPHSDQMNASLIEWRKVLKLYLEADLGDKCFNVCFVTDIGAASRKSDISKDTEGKIQRIEASMQLSTALIESLSFCKGDSFFSAVAFSEESEVFGTSELEPGIDRKTVRIRSRTVAQDYEEWIAGLLDQHGTSASGPSKGLSEGIDLAKLLSNTNNKPTIIVFLSSGTYSIGRNPVATVKKGLTDSDGITIFCVGLGEKCEETILSAIADATNGAVAFIKNIEDIQEVKELILTRIGKDV
ncbi:MAG: hypothetical protein ACFFF4_17845, partial [Candidatus Thorarchaeota archaeon]